MPIIEAKGIEESDGVVFPTIPTDRYGVRVNNLELGDSSTGKPMMTLFLKVISGDHEGHDLRCFIMLPGKDQEDTEYNRNVARLKRLCNALDYTDIPPEGPDTDEIMSGEFMAVVVEKEVEGVKQNNVKDYLPLT